MLLIPIGLLTAVTTVVGPAYAENQPKVRRNVEIEFEAVEGATMYEVQVVRKDDRTRKPLRFKTKDPLWQANIKPGLYEMQVRAYDDRDVPGDWSSATDLQVRLPAIIVKEPGPESTIQAKNPKEQDVTLKWEPIPGAKGYKVVLQGENDSFKIEKEVSEPELETTVPSGHNVSWNVIAIDDKGEDGEQSSEPYKFQLLGPALEKPQINKPMSKFVREMEWHAPEHAKSYAYNLSYYNPRKKGWETVASASDSKDNKLKMDITRPSGKYRLSVQARGDFRNPSPKTQLDFYMQAGFKDENEFENAIQRDSITKPTHFYAIASYLISEVSYSFQNREGGNRASFNALGGTGRLGAGYQEPRSDWGGFVIVDYSGFIIEGQRFTFASAEGHLTRKLEFGQGGLLLFGFGLFTKELPIVNGSPADGFEGVGKVRNNGPHAGASYWIPLNDRFGMQVNGRVYYTMFGASTSGQKSENTVSMQYGLLGTYRLSRSWMGYAGYAYRRDEASFAATPLPTNFAQPGQLDAIMLEGHYLNLLLEFSF